jgi:hypothetical protein
MNIHEVMEYGPIVAHDEELDTLITVNGAYFNLWVGGYRGLRGDGAVDYVNTEAYDVASRLDLGTGVSPFNPLESVPLWTVTETAEKLLAEVLAEGEEE